uniref:Truncated polymerase n=1 Tax=Hepatitis B virus TaxID=10407 RepID=D9U5P6_HBV|nr:truncated polymerase [Hepatitis B virus]
MPLSYQHFRKLLLFDDEAGPLEEELPRLADEGLNRRVAEDLNLGNLNVSIPWTHKVGNFTGFILLLYLSLIRSGKLPPFLTFIYRRTLLIDVNNMWALLQLMKKGDYN